jgi:hypothetical protein
MAIRKKDRSFDDILKDIIMEEVPTEYITHLHLKLKNGDVLEFAQDKLLGMKDAKDVLKNEGLEHLKEQVVDVEVFLDSAKLKNNVTKYTRNLFQQYFDKE